MLLSNSKFSLLRFFAALLILTGCDLSRNKKDPAPSLFKIIESSAYDIQFNPTSVEAVEDGYLILGEIFSENTTFSPIFLIKLDKNGKILWYKKSTDRYNPCSKLLKSESGNYFFVAMQDGTFAAELIQADSTLSTLHTIGEATFPLAADKIDRDVLIVGYNTFNRQTTLTKTTESGNTAWTQTYDVFEDVQENISNHLLRLNPRPFPFYVRNAGANHYVFNGLNNFTLAHTYVSKSNGTQTGVINGVRYQYGVADFLLKSGNAAILARHKGNGNLVVVPNYVPNTNGILASKDLAGIELPEASPFTKVVIKTGNVLGKDLAIVACNTKSGQILLLAYNLISGDITGTRYIGSNTLYEIGDVSFATDNSILVTGKVQSVGRFGRVFFTKLNESDLINWIK